jgi:hypothetical protein
MLEKLSESWKQQSDKRLTTLRITEQCKDSRNAKVSAGEPVQKTQHFPR